MALPDARMGEIVRAYVVVRPGVARPTTPESVVVVAVLPRNASGKVLKHVLRKAARK